MKSARTRLKKLGLSCGALVAILVVAELAIRLIAPQQESMQWFMSDARYGYVNRPNFTQYYDYEGCDFTMVVRTDAAGHRGTGCAVERLHAPGVRRVLLTGDSFTFGSAVQEEDTFAAGLQRELVACGVDACVINAGVGGWGTIQALQYAADHLERYNPDAVVYTFCDNDPHDDSLFRRGLRDNDRGVLRFPGKRFLKHHSQLYRLLFYSYSRFAARRASRAGNQEDGERGAAHPTETVISAEQWRLAEEFIAQFAAEYRAFKPEGRLVIQATSPWNTSIRSALAGICKRHGITYVDLMPRTAALTAAERRTPHDAHWGVKVHTVSASMLADALSDWCSRD